MLNLDGTSIYTSEKHGNDEQGDGSEAKPFKTPLQVFDCRNVLHVVSHSGHIRFFVIMVIHHYRVIPLQSMSIRKMRAKYATKKDLFSLSVNLYFQGKWEQLSKAQGKKVKIQYEEEKRKQERTNQHEVIRKIVYFFMNRSVCFFSKKMLNDAKKNWAKPNK